MSPFSKRLYLLYHELRDLPSDYLYAIDRVTFEQHADFFVQARSSFREILWPEITFDDGHISNFDLALPILAGRSLEATFFITVGWTGTRENYMGWDHLRALTGAGQRIGAHGWTHTLLTHCDDQALRKELTGARMVLEDRLGTAITSVSLPGGRFDRRVLAACAEAGYTQIYTSIPKAAPSDGSALVGRLNIRSTMDVDWMARLLDPRSGLLAGLEHRDRWKHALQKTIGDRMYAKLWAVLNQHDAAATPDEAAGP